MTTGKYNLEDFVGKIDWEGGLVGALEYGLSTDDYDIPEDVAEKWEEIVEYFDEFESLSSDFWALIRAHGVEY
ncbi:hypothetical protein HWB05_gp112 [Streptomyces phage BRock]|uniref:Uncharacterized protein n=1 Tax=Streptomyces phage BRock TaxID=1913591 RepID=A0A1J0GW21_9CAUD|nr:hypothetical protein HWB05_gp112 [Streptomyces phage BRock]APC46374.1 hypothetical protein [Streptomyces phage BRock]